MDGKGRALDNIFTERLWRTVKYEEVYLKEYASLREARRDLSAFPGFLQLSAIASGSWLPNTRSNLFQERRSIH
jgi:hypothetical protein